MPAKSVVIGVDVGSSSARAVAIDHSGTVLGTAKVEYAGADRWDTGHADPRAWRAAVDTAVTDVLARWVKHPPRSPSAARACASCARTERMRSR